MDEWGTPSMTQPRTMTADRGPRRHGGFSLVELSIAIVVIALMVGGVLSGRSMIRASELRSITTQHGQLLNAISAFREKYGYFPGDIPNATSYWGIAAGDGNNAACRVFESTTTATCNGDGDGQIRSLTPGPEPTRLFQHLSNAGLLSGSYTGAYDGGGHSAKNSLSGKIPNSGWAIFYFNDQSGDPNFFDGVYGNVIYMGGFSAGNGPKIPILKPEEIWSIDDKTDDGKPATGKIVVYANVDLSNCTTTSLSSNLTADYDVTLTTRGCVIAWRQQFQ